MCSIQMSIVAGEFMGTLQRVDQLITRKYSRELVLLLTAMLMMIRPVSSLVPVQITSSLSVPTGSCLIPFSSIGVLYFCFSNFSDYNSYTHTSERYYSTFLTPT